MRLAGNLDVKRFLTWDWLLLFVIVVVSFAMRWRHIDSPLVGYQVWNEAFYANLGRQHLAMAPLSPLFSPIDVNNPPLYALVLRFALEFGGEVLSTARAVSVLASTATIVAVYLLGRDLYTKCAGLVAATVYGLAPGSVLVGGSAQIDGLMILLRVSAVLCYVRARQNRSTRYALAAGVLMGLAMLTKLPAIVVLPAFALWETWDSKSLSWLRERRTAVFATAFAVTALPWYLGRLLLDSHWAGAQQRLVSTFELPNMETLEIWFGSELFWLVSPVVFGAFLLAVLLLTLRRQSSDVLVLSMLGLDFGFYLFYSYHTYYLLPAVPAVGLAMGAHMLPLRLDVTPRRTIAVVTMLAVLLSIFAAVSVGGKQWGGWYAHDVRDMVVDLGYAPEQVVIEVDDIILDTWDPAIRAAFADSVVVHYPPRPDEQVPGDRPVLRLAWNESTGDISDPATIKARAAGPVFFGRAVFLPATSAVNHFGIVDAEFEKVGPWWHFGIADRDKPTDLSLVVVKR